METMQELIATLSTDLDAAISEIQEVKKTLREK
jgi:hypothetical protein